MHCKICGAAIPDDAMGPFDSGDTEWVLCGTCTTMADKLAVPSRLLDGWGSLTAYLRHKARILPQLAGVVALDLLRAQPGIVAPRRAGE